MSGEQLVAMTGRLCVIVNPQGRVIGTGVDFNTDVRPGRLVDDMQRERAEEAAWDQVLGKLAFDPLYRAIKRCDYAAVSGIRRALETDGWTVTFREVEIGDAEASE